ncbi:5-methyltetrahydropteroyltriglutamate--homocysteine S-methyltransferase [Utexia brackfieldae]|uniref:5-methyltetrahydropteroyltriglutamate-- homocysteine S-methyltransferase n=1 Tax=Utexia brackfieldae TaxID=3074108 RepID=UPI00370D1684
MKTAVIGYPRIGTLRELKFATEQYFKGQISESALLATAEKLRQAHWLSQQQAKIDFIASNDFSFYDQMLDTAVLLNAIPARYRQLRLSPLEQYFAMARGYQGENGDVKALPMKKWFNTNYHYLEPELDDESELKLVGDTFIQAYLEAKALNIDTKPVIIGPFTFLKLVRYRGKKRLGDFIPQAITAYQAILHQLNKLATQWVQFDEPALVMDLDQTDIADFTALYQAILPKKQQVKVLLQTYFGDIRDSYVAVTQLDFDGIGLDFVEGEQSLSLLQKHGFSEKVLFAGVVNGKNIWKNNYAKTLKLLAQLSAVSKQTVLSTSCSLLHVPYSLVHETQLAAEHKRYFAFAQEKLTELSDLSHLAEVDELQQDPLYQDNQHLFASARYTHNAAVHDRVAGLTEADFKRTPALAVRAEQQVTAFALPLLPTTTIGSFPQTAEIRSYRAQFKKGEISAKQYQRFIQQKIADCIAVQTQIGLDVLVHGEFERNDMVEFFGEHLAGFLFTEKAWVQSYGTRCVKPPIIWGDVARRAPMTVPWSVYAQAQTDKLVKGMLTGPVTILNWSFPREDLALRESALQIALAIREEVLDLEAAGIRIIQVDEAALKEKLPLRRQDWHRHYLDWAIPAFRLVHSGVKPQTQIHTHMCYSEFAEIIPEIDAMDADVISFEASRSNLSIIQVLKSHHFQTAVGPGVYDIHSPRIPSVEEISQSLEQMLFEVGKHKLWVNPDCGLKTRGEPETVASLTHMVAAAKAVRQKLIKLP